MFELGPPRGWAVCFHWRCGFIRRVLRRMERRFRLFEAIGRLALWPSVGALTPRRLSFSLISGYCFGRLMLKAKAAKAIAPAVIQGRPVHRLVW